MAAREEQPCVRCRRDLETNQIGVCFPMYARTVGIQPRFQSESHMAYVCVECAIGIAGGMIEFPKGQPLYAIAHLIVRDVVAQNPAFIIAFWKSLREKMGLPPMMIPAKGDLSGEVLPHPKRLNAAG
jgi:hypothetical protein